MLPALIWPISIIITTIAYIIIIQYKTDALYTILLPIIILGLCVYTLSKYVTYVKISDIQYDNTKKWYEYVDGNMTYNDIISKLGIMTMSDIH